MQSFPSPYTGFRRQQLSGSVPRSIGNMSGFSRNPNDTIGHLELINEPFERKIPSSICRLQSLETLDLSRNQLSGIIPPSMVSITSLNHLNLSYNSLSGKIPSANQFQTFDDPSIYEGNNGLCGLPLPTKCNDDDGPSKRR
ncbi:hypothetical protein REPUB_Repub09cG0011500 [Reevesia pubescens]